MRSHSTANASGLYSLPDLLPSGEWVSFYLVLVPTRRGDIFFFRDDGEYGTHTGTRTLGKGQNCLSVCE